MNNQRLKKLIKFAESEIERVKALGYSTDIEMNKSYAYWKGYAQGLKDFQVTK